MAEIAKVLFDAATRLSTTSDTARLDAEVLMAHALGVSRMDLLLRHMREEEPEGFEALLARRLRHEPVAYITGSTEFYGLEMSVSPAVLIPRGDSETLIEAVRLALEERPPARILDLGTGSGALLIAALSLFPEAHGTGIDRSEEALGVARDNARGNGMASRTQFLSGDWTHAGWNRDLGQFDLILANPPYVEDTAQLDASVAAFEPSGALFAGPEGLDDYRVLIPQIAKMLAPHGLAMVEIGYRQADAVMALGQAANLASRLHRDLADRPRAIAFSRLLHH